MVADYVFELSFIQFQYSILYKLNMYWIEEFDCLYMSVNKTDESVRREPANLAYMHFGPKHYIKTATNTYTESIV